MTKIQNYGFLVEVLDHQKGWEDEKVGFLIFISKTQAFNFIERHIKNTLKNKKEDVCYKYEMMHYAPVSDKIFQKINAINNVNPVWIYKIEDILNPDYEENKSEVKNRCG